jgi:chaperone required for assembly of F1-ATPase
MKKFYKMVSTSPANGGYQVELDGKPVKAVNGRLLLCPAQGLADEIAREWAAQGDEIDQQTLPLTQILTTAQNTAPSERDIIQDKILSYLDTDLLCYRTEMPEELARAQKDAWDQWLEWFASRYEVSLKTTTGLQALQQDRKALEAAEKRLGELDIYQFTAVQIVTALCGSLVLALAFIDHAASPEDLYEACNVEENYKSEIYNEDIHGPAPMQEQKQQAMKNELQAARLFLDSLKN